MIHDGFDIFDSPVRNSEGIEGEKNEDVIAQKQILIQISARREVENYLDHTIIEPTSKFFHLVEREKVSFPT